MYYATANFHIAIDMYAGLLRRESDALTPASVDYLNFSIGLCHHRLSTRDGKNQNHLVKAHAKWQEVIRANDHSFSEYRAAFMLAQTVDGSNDPKLQRLRMPLLRQLSVAKKQNEFTYRASIVLASELHRYGQTAEARAALLRIPADAGPWYDIAQYFLNERNEAWLK